MCWTASKLCFLTRIHAEEQQLQAAREAEEEARQAAVAVVDLESDEELKKLFDEVSVLTGVLCITLYFVLCTLRLIRFVSNSKLIW